MMTSKKQLDGVFQHSDTSSFHYRGVDCLTTHLLPFAIFLIIGRAVRCLRLKLDGDSLKVLVRNGLSRDPLVLKVFLCKHDGCVSI